MNVTDTTNIAGYLLDFLFGGRFAWITVIALIFVGIVLLKVVLMAIVGAIFFAIIGAIFFGEAGATLGAILGFFVYAHGALDKIIQESKEDNRR